MTDIPRPSSACAVVVGAGARQGIGGALCARFAAGGLQVYAAGRSAEKLEPLVASIRASGVALPRCGTRRVRRCSAPASP